MMEGDETAVVRVSKFRPACVPDVPAIHSQWFHQREAGDFLGDAMARKPKDARIRFESRMIKTETCWELPQSIRYGKITVGTGSERKTVSGHRFAYSTWVGDIPEGMCVCHHCDNPKCVRPDHLFLGTHKDNTDDAIKKGHRSWAGSRNPKYNGGIYAKNPRERIREYNHRQWLRRKARSIGIKEDEK